MRCIGKGLEAAKTLCAVLDLPPPPAIFQNYSSMLNRAIKEISIASMMNAAKETVEINGSTDIAVAVDGPWQRRGHTSLSSVVTATSVATGKVIDVECLTKYCSKCKLKVGAHICYANYAGPSGGMEAKGAVDIFWRSEHAHSARYVGFLGDGDSKAHLAVNEAKPYENGSKTTEALNEWKGKKLSDGKALSGKGRLTGTEIDNIQRYYGLAIRNNCHDLRSMRKAVWATYFHKLSTDETPQHGLCPAGADSWCRYRRAEASGEVYEYKHSLPETVMNLMKPIFRELSDENLLKKCLHGRTQNANESFNNLIWTRVPKTVFVGLDTLKIGVRDAVLSFNEGAISRVNVLENIDIGCGWNMRTALLKIDKQRVQKAEVEASNISKSSKFNFHLSPSSFYDISPLLKQHRYEDYLQKEREREKLRRTKKLSRKELTAHMDLELMSKALSQQTKCKYCECDSLSIQEDIKKRKELARSLVIVCAVCRKEGTFQTSKVTASGYENLFLKITPVTVELTITKEDRVKKRNEKRKREEETEEGQNHYAPGMF
ncbi:hypothetical protein ANN_10983 [Periplaneta americana]|uniref:Mutator-like transposase domain-containing protein n=1 Tax=Periplaneta americana TaxID=6978 RepID=A0ABQ8T3R9_PERAM|nr:hypothetical protein ANN_10983 [Periplaneta americana]